MLLLLWFSSFLTFSSTAQMQLDASRDAEFYVKNVLLGPGVQVGKITHIGMVGGLGQFDADSTVIGVSSGLVLSTGNIDSVRGPNDNSGCTSSGQWPDSRKMRSKVRRGDKDLNKICKGRSVDITVIEFDFVPVKNKLEFNFVFASEEYREFVGSNYNDVFGFFLSGPGIRKKVNLAVLPDGKTPISVNTINHKVNSKFYRSNYRLYR